MTTDARQIRRRARVLGWLLVFVTWPVARSYATCPQRLCDCLGEATAFAVVGVDEASIRHGWQAYYGYVDYYGADVLGDACAPKAIAAGRTGSPFSGSRSEMDNLFAFAGPGELAAKFITQQTEPSTTPGVEVTGVVATGGGSVVGDVAAGSIDTSGTHPSIARCQQATVDARTASATLAALTPTQNLGRVVLRGERLDITAGPGVNVINADSISMRPRRIDPYYWRVSWINVFTQADTEAVIVNTKSLSFGRDCGFFSNDKVIINVHGPGNAVKIALDNSIDTPILAPERNVKVGLARVSNVFARKVRLRGATVYDSYGACATTTSTSSTSTTTLP